MEQLVTLINSKEFWICTISTLIVGCIIGYFIHDFVNKKIFCFKLESCILWVSLVAALGCLVLSIAGENTISIQILSFYTSFIFAWLLTKSSSQSEFRRMQHKVAKNTYRHIEDVETTVLITKERVEGFCKRETSVTAGELNGIVDELNAILTGIRSNKDDWKDMLKKKYIKKHIENQEDPEGKLEKLKLKPNAAELKEEFKDMAEPEEDA